MARLKETKEIPINDLIVGKGQVRTRDVHKEIEELADSIRVQGLLQPIVVCEAEKKGKYEILSGQRRVLAHKHLKLPTIRAVVLDERVDEMTAKSISLTENMVRRDLSQKEKIDACTALYKKYGSIKAVSEETGLPSREVSQFVKYDRLMPQLKKLVDAGDVDVRVALRAQDAAAAGGEKADAKEAVLIAKEMSSMSGAQQKKLVKEREDNPDSAVVDVIESARTGGKVTQVIVTLTGDVHRQLQNFAQQEGVTQDDAAGSLIEEALADKGFGT